MSYTVKSSLNYYNPIHYNYCPNCGKKTQPNDNFCTECGRYLWEYNYYWYPYYNPIWYDGVTWDGGNIYVTYGVNIE